MVAKFKLILAGIGAILLAIVAAFFKGRSNGKSEVVKQVQKQHEEDVVAVAAEQVRSVNVKNDSQQKAIISSDSTIDSELSDKWTRG